MPSHKTINPVFTEKQLIFAEHYARHGNASEAARQAGYSVQTCRQAGCRTLKIPHVAEKVRELRQKMTSEAILDGKRLRQLAAEFANSPSYKPADRMRAMDIAAKLDGLYAADRVEHTVTELSEKERAERLAILTAKIKGETQAE